MIYGVSNEIEENIDDSDEESSEDENHQPVSFKELKTNWFGFRDSLKYFDTETLISGTMSSKHLNEFCRNMDEMMLRQTIARHKEKKISDYFTLV